MKRDILALLVTSLISGYCLWPLLRDPTHQVVNDYDGVLIAWIHATVSEHFKTFYFRHFFDGRIFYPHANTLAFSEPFITNSLVSFPVWSLTHEPIALLTFQTVLAQILTAAMLFFLLHEVTDDRLLSVGLALAFTFSPLRMAYAGHLQMFQLAGVILAFLALIKVGQAPSRGWLAVFWGAFLFQLGNSLLTAWFILFAAGWWYISDKHLRINLGRWWWWPGVLALPLVLPYINVMRTYDYTRPLTDVIHFSLSPEQIFTTFWSPLLFTVLGLGMAVGGKYGRRWLILGMGALVMALGPVFHWLGQTVKIPFHIPLPYLVFYYVLPGFNGLRTPSRWIVLAGLAITVWAAIRIARLPRRWRRVIGALLVAAVLVTVKPVGTTAVPSKDEYPAVYTWLKDQPGEAVIELPIFRWGSDEFAKNETWRMLYQTEHGKALVNGYSGFSPPEWEDLVARIHQEFPSPALLNELRQRGVDYLVLHTGDYARWKGYPETERVVVFMRDSGYNPLHISNNSIVYEL